MIWEKGGKKGEDSRRREPPLFLSRISTIDNSGRRTLSFAVSFLVFVQKKPTRSGGPWDVFFRRARQTKRKDDESGETYGVETPKQFFEKKKKRIGGGFFPVCVFERDWKRNSFPKPTLRRFGGRKRVANVVVARHGPKVRRSLSLSLCVCVCFSLLCVFAIDTFWSREEVGSFFSYI